MQIQSLRITSAGLLLGAGDHLFRIKVDIYLCKHMVINDKIYIYVTPI